MGAVTPRGAGNCPHVLFLLEKMVRPGGFEPPTSWFVVLYPPINTFEKNIRMYIFLNV